MSNMTFGERIVYYRKRKGLLQKELAELSGISASALNYYEKDKREPNVKTIKKIASVLNVTGDDLLGLPTISNSYKYTEDNSGLSNLEENLVDQFRQLDKENQEHILKALDMAIRSQPPKECYTISKLENVG